MAAMSGYIRKYELIIYFFIGASIGFLMPGGQIAPPAHRDIVSMLIALELNHINLISSLGAMGLVCWIIMRKTRGRETIIVYGALGFVVMRLLVSLVSLFAR